MVIVTTPLRYVSYITVRKPKIELKSACSNLYDVGQTISASQKR